MKGFQIPVTVRFRDLDAMGHVNNAVYFTYFEEGRKYFFYHLYNVSDPSGFEFILARISCDFMKPVNLACTPVLRLWVKEIGRKSFNLGYQLMDEKDETVVYARGESVQVCYDYKTQKSMEVSEALREKLTAYQML
jgi:acyl-CoA thioester hydrolase